MEVNEDNCFIKKKKTLTLNILFKCVLLEINIFYCHFSGHGNKVVKLDNLTQKR